MVPSKMLSPIWGITTSVGIIGSRSAQVRLGATPETDIIEEAMSFEP
jgi:hypothetical protein